MSNRFASCGPAARSAQQSVTTNVGNPAWTESTTEARTQPDVVAPHTSTVSTRAATSIAATEVPANAEGPVFATTGSLLSRPNRGSISTHGDPGASPAREGTLRTQVVATRAPSS